MKDKLKAALDQALNNEVNELFKILVINKIGKDNDAIKAFTKGLTITIDAYAQACLVIDQITEV